MSTAVFSSPRVRIAIYAVLGVITVVLLVMGFQALRARAALTDASAAAKQLQSDIRANNTVAAKSTLGQLQESAATAHHNTDGPLWAASTHLPFIGDDVTAVRTVSASLDDISSNALPPLLDAADSLNPNLFKPVDGHIDVSTFEQLQPAASSAHTVLERNAVMLDSLDTSTLMEPIAGPVNELRDKVEDANSAVGAVSTALNIIPATIGSSEPQRYLLVFQNNAEARSTGGLPGSFAILDVHNGQVSIESSGAGNAFPHWEIGQAAQITDEESTAFGSIAGQVFLNANLNPDFPRAAEVWTEMLEHTGEAPFDGVIAIDPVALGYVLAGTGPVTLADGTVLNSENAAQVLMYDVYAKYSNPTEQDLFFQDAVNRTFTALTSGQGDWRKVISGLAEGTSQRRVMVWFADTQRQEEISGTTIANELPGGGSDPQVGLYLNDVTQSKMQNYLRYSTKITPQRCSPDGQQTFSMTTTFRSTAPIDVSTIPPYVNGSNQFSDPGSQALAVYLFGPSNGTIDSIELNGTEMTQWSGFSFSSRPMQPLLIRVDPGQELTLTVLMHSGTGQTGSIIYNETPGVKDSAGNVSTPGTCS